jgi:sporulation protein YlmC with PRC-barrel domain
MRTLSSLLRRKVETESGDSLGRCYDLRGELTPSKLTVTGLCVGRGGWLEHFGISSHDTHHTIPWSAIVRIEGKRIIIGDDALSDADAGADLDPRPGEPYR